MKIKLIKCFTKLQHTYSYDVGVMDSDGQREMCVVTAEFASSPFCHFSSSFKTEGGGQKHHLSMHITSLLLHSQMKAQYVAPFNGGW